MRTAHHIKFILDSGTNMMTALKLERHGIPDRMMNISGEKKRETVKVKAAGNMLHKADTWSEPSVYGDEQTGHY